MNRRGFMFGAAAIVAATPAAVVISGKVSAHFNDHLTLEEYIKNDIRLTRFAHYGTVTGRWKHSAAVVYRDGHCEEVKYGDYNWKRS